MSSRRYELLLPDLGMGVVQVLSSLWLVDAGTPVNEGDRLLEIVAGDVTVDLSAPASGTLAEILVGEDEPLSVGQLLAVILGDPDEDEETD